jgi:hypothetical protein
VTAPAPAAPVRPGEIADLLAWCTRLHRAGTAAGPAEIAAYQAAKADLLQRIADSHTDDDPDLAARAGQAAAAARSAVKETP